MRFDGPHWRQSMTLSVWLRLAGGGAMLVITGSGGANGAACATTHYDSSLECTSLRGAEPDAEDADERLRERLPTGLSVRPSGLSMALAGSPWS